MRTWLYRIATNACLNAMARHERRVLPSGLGAPDRDVPGSIGERLLEVAWLEPVPDALLGADPASIVARRETTRLAFVAALQHLTARQRAALLLRDVAGLSAAETATLLGWSTAAANSALQRAREQITAIAPAEDDVVDPPEASRVIVEQLARAMEEADLGAMARLLRHDVELEMPPVPAWFAGHDAVLKFYDRFVFAVPRRHLAVAANGGPALASYRQEADGRFHAHNILLVDVTGGAVRRLSAFVDPMLFATFGVPPVI